MMRSAILRRLAGLTRDRLVVVEGPERREFGPGGGLTAEVRVLDPAFWRRIALGGSLGAAEAWLDGQWDAADLPVALRVLLRNLPALRRLEGLPARLLAPLRRFGHFLKRNTPRGSRKNIEAHYDLGNAFFRLFLDESMTYSAALFPRPGAGLREAQAAKLDRICVKLGLSPSDHVVEIGTGWGSFALHAAGRYGCRVTTTTISREQHALATERVRAAGLADRVRVLDSDYRDLTGRFDALVSIEMIEAVGHTFLPAWFRKCSDLLAEDGRMAMQAILMPDRGYRDYLASVDFIRRHVFPGSSLPCHSSLLHAMARATDLRMVHVEDLTPHYARTLALWRERYLANRDAVRALGYPERFLRLWDYYLAYCEAGFAERYIADRQIVLEKPWCRRPSFLPGAGGEDVR